MRRFGTAGPNAHTVIRRFRCACFQDLSPTRQADDTKTIVRPTALVTRDRLSGSPCSKNALAALTLAAALGCAHAQESWLDQEAHRPYIRQPVPDGQRPTGYTPKQMRHAYGVDLLSNQGDGQIIGIVDAFDYPSVESDLAVFTSAFQLPLCTKANGCLTVVYATGTKPPPNAGWSGETSLDVQWAHAIAPKAQILLVEAANGTYARAAGSRAGGRRAWGHHHQHELGHLA